MRTIPCKLLTLAVAVAFLTTPLPGTCGTVPCAESFESYTNGHPMAQVSGWTAATNVVVSTNADAIAAFTNVTFALSLVGAQHAKVLQLGGWATNAIASGTGGVVVADLLVMPSRRDWLPDEDATARWALYAGTNGHLVIWHQNRTNTAVNEWRELTNSPALATDQWARVTIRQDLAVAMYQVSVNGGVPLVDDAGWTSNNGARPGSWFYMVQTNNAMAQLCMIGEARSYLDDLVVANRSLGFSTNGFAEAAANNGTIDGTPMTIQLMWDTFAATNNENLALNTNKLCVTTLPPGLAVSALAASPTQLTVTVTGQTSPHEAENSVSNLTFAFGNEAFTSGRAWDVAGASTTNLVVQFQSSAVAELVYSTSNFVERAANDGGVVTTAGLTLFAKDFAGTNGENLVASGRVNVPNPPNGLTASVVQDAARHATLSFTGRATVHTAAASLTNLTVTFGDLAFVGGNAAAVTNASRSDLTVTFHDPPVVGYGGAAFSEAAANNGTVTNTLTLTLTGDTFTNATFVQGTHFSATNVPPGLTMAVAAANPTQVVVSLTGVASPHASGANRTISFALLDAAFQTVGASNIVGSTNAFGVTFLDPPVVSANPAGFTETATNNGAIGNAVNLTLTGDAFANVSFASNVHYSATGVPAGLTFAIARTSATQLVASLTGNAAAHAASNGTSIVVTFLNAAFQTVAASNIAGTTQSLGVTFLDRPVASYDGVAFTEAVANNGTFTSVLTVSLVGDTFTNAAFVKGTQFTASGEPAGLSLAVAVANPTQVVLSLTGSTSPHTSLQNGVIQFAFRDAAFNQVAAVNITGSSNTFTFGFLDPPVLGYAPLTFTERGDDIGAIGNTVAITLTGDSFATGPLLSNVHYTVTGVPAGLTFALTRTSGSLVTASLTGEAVAHSNVNDTTIGFTFLGAAFQNVAVTNIVGTSTNLAVDFIEAPPANAVPYTDTFESYADGLALIGTNGWLAASADSAVVTSDTGSVPAVTSYTGQFPMPGPHTQTLQLNDGVTNRTRSVAWRTVCLDCMAYIIGREGASEVGAGDQLGFYVNTNQQAVIWRRDRTGAGTNGWLVMSGSSVTTGAWHRLTVYQNHGAGMFQVYVDGQMLTDATGWSGPGGAQPGPWFYMVQTNGYLSQVAFMGGSWQTPGYMDDLSITYKSPPAFGVVYRFR
jgi:hypothetical protein